MKTITKQPEVILLEDGRTIPMPAKKKPEHLKKFQFKPGESGNPGGKPVGARNTLGANFLRALSEDFDKNGAKVISKARNKDPVGYLKIIAGTLPKQMEKVAPLEELSDAELSAGIALLRSRLSVAETGARENPQRLVKAAS